MQDWWLTPELYLRRPAAYYPEWRLDRLLQRKAEEGIKVYVIVYKEVRPTTSPQQVRGASIDCHRLPKQCQ